MIKDRQDAKERIILALDVDTFEEAKILVTELKEHVGIFKVGLQLYISAGPDIIKFIHDEGGRVFFDIKLHDIPDTVAKTSANIVKLGVDFFNVHASGGSKMMLACTKAVKETSRELGVEKPLVFAMTLLTSFGQRTLTEELDFKKNIDDYVCNLAKLSTEAGLDGIMASAGDVPKIRSTHGDDFTIVCPAVRPTWAVVNDQIRAVTPSDAIKSGADLMVIGRPVTKAADRVAAVKLILDEVQAAIDNKNEEMGY